MDIKKCSFSGHRPASFPWGYNENDDHCVWLKQRLEKEIENAIKDGFNYFIIGGAMGVDLWCGEIVLLKKPVYNDIKLEVAIPFWGYEKRFPHDLKKRAHAVFNKANSRVDTSNIIKSSNMISLYHNRNKYMVDNSQRVIVVYDKYANIKGGTYQTYNYARKKNKEIVTIEWKSEYNNTLFL